MTQKDDPGLLDLVGLDRRIELTEEIQELFNELYGAIDSVRSETEYLARALRSIMFGVTSPSLKDGWQSRITP